MGVKDFFLSQMLKRQLKKVPEGQRAVIEKMIKNNPIFFEKLAKEINEKKKAGMDETMATMLIMKKYQSEFQKLAKDI